MWPRRDKPGTQRLILACPECGRAVPLQSRYCVYCGTHLELALQRTERARRLAEQQPFRPAAVPRPGPPRDDRFADLRRWLAAGELAQEPHVPIPEGSVGSGMLLVVAPCVYAELELYDDIQRRLAEGLRHPALEATLATATERLAYLQQVLRQRREVR